MGALSKTDAAVEAALIALGLSEDEAQFALRDMLIEEVSYVDRAANKRKFLVVKSAGGSMGSKVNKDESEPGVGGADKDMPMTLTTAVKEGLLRVLTESLERLVSAVEMVKGAEETTETEGVEFPEALGSEIGTITDLLGGALSQYSSPMSKDTTEEGGATDSLKSISAALAGCMGEDGTVDAAKVAEAIKQLGALLPAPDGTDDPTVTSETKADEALAQVLAQAGEIAVALSEKAGTEDELSAETVAGVRQLAAMLNEVAEQYPEPQAKRFNQTLKAAGDAKAKLEEVLASLNIDTSDGTERAAHEVWGAIDALIGAMRLDDILKTGDDAAPEEPTAATAEAVANAAAEVEKAGRKMSAARLKQLKSAVEALAKLIGELETEKAEKRLAGETAQPDPAKGPYGSVGTGGSADDTQAGPAQAEDVEGLEDVMKRLASLQKSVAEMQNTPDAPASRREPEPTKVTKTDDSAANGTPRRRRGGPWVW